MCAWLDKYSFVSKFVAEQLNSRCSDKRQFILDSNRRAEEFRNRTFPGWIFELAFAFQLHEAAKLPAGHLVVHMGNCAHSWPVSQFLSYENLEDINSLICGMRSGESLWLRPCRWNHPGFDFLMFELSEGKLRITAVNAVSGSTHVLKLVSLWKLATKLAARQLLVSSICFYFLVDPAFAKDFQVSQVLGRLCEWDAPSGAKWPNVDNANILIEKGCLCIATLARTV